jgi:hypothetical protein
VVNQLTITLEQPEYAALLQMAVAELRTPPDQLRHILRQELARRQLWPPEQVSDPPLAETQDGREREARQ